MSDSISTLVIRQKPWSEATFGKGPRTNGILSHIEKELEEIRSNPTDLEEWCDVILLALDGAWRAGHPPSAIAEQLYRKQDVNFMRQWPEPTDQNRPTEHYRWKNFACPNCGGRMEGDGYSRVFHCENADVPPDIEADARPVFCKQSSHDANTFSDAVPKPYQVVCPHCGRVLTRKTRTPQMTCYCGAILIFGGDGQKRPVFCGHPLDRLSQEQLAEVEKGFRMQDDENEPYPCWDR